MLYSEPMLMAGSLSTRRRFTIDPLWTNTMRVFEAGIVKLTDIVPRTVDSRIRRKPACGLSVRAQHEADIPELPPPI
jgi:hypothetical protein